MMQKLKWMLLIITMLPFILIACGGNPADGNTATNSDVPPAVATMPPARFTAVAQQSVSQTTPISGTTIQSVTAQVDVPDLERGARAYEKNKCADCHGVNGEGVTGQGLAIAGTVLSTEAFATVLRTGGGLGNSHIFGPSAISPGGMGVLYAYVKALPVP